MLCRHAHAEKAPFACRLLVEKKNYTRAGTDAHARGAARLRRTTMPKEMWAPL